MFIFPRSSPYTPPELIELLRSAGYEFALIENHGVNWAFNKEQFDPELEDLWRAKRAAPLLRRARYCTIFAVHSRLDLQPGP